MKKIKNITQKSWTLILALIFLSSCYEIVYVSQESDTHSLNQIKTKVCINLLDFVSPSETPYFGILLPDDWKVNNTFPYSQPNEQSGIAGKIHFSDKLTTMMQKIDPAPNGYCWWVGMGNQKIKDPGIYTVYPSIYSGNNEGNYSIKYMIGDTYHGLNYVKSKKQPIYIADSKTPTKLTAQAMDQTIQLNWLAPLANIKIAGYIVYRDGHRLNKPLITERTYTDYSARSGSHYYNVQAVYNDGLDGYMSSPANICCSSQGPSMKFDGVNDKVIVFDNSSLHINSHITLEAWIKPEYSESIAPRIISKGISGSGYELYLENINSELFLKFDSNAGALTSLNALTPGIWHHVAVTYNGVEMKLFINGRMDNSKQYSLHLKTSHLPLVIGRSSGVIDNYFSGNIDNVRIWSIARTNEEIKTSFSKTIAENEPGLVGNWNMNEGCSNSTLDLSGENNTGFIEKCNWCATEFPYVEATNSNTNPDLVVPVMNYNVVDNNPDYIELKFKINPNLLSFEGINLFHTQIQYFGKVKTYYDPDGTIRIYALNVYHSTMHGDVLLYLDLKPLQPYVNTTLDFYTYIADGVSNRTQSASIIATDLLKTQNNLKSEPILKNTYNGFEADVYPNPAKYSINIKIINSTLPVDILITNTLGQVVYSNQLSAYQQEYIYKINTSQFEKGVYFINLNHGNEKSVKKLAIH